MKYLNNLLKKASELKVLIIGETIIDEYIFVTAKGRATKDPILSTRYISKEKYLGGVLASARHLGQFVKDVHILTLLGDLDSHEEMIKKELEKNIKFEYFYKSNSPTIVKTRYLEPNHNHKLFKVENVDDNEISGISAKMIINRIEELKNDYDLVLVNDFGHELFNDALTDYICSLNKFIGLNVQTNSSNYGYNPVIKYKKADFVSMNETELKLPYHLRKFNPVDLVRKMKDENEFKEILLTMGKEGCLFIRNKMNFSKSFISNPIDTIGAGDAVFAISSIFSFLGTDESLLPKYSNAIGALAVEIIGNKNPITRKAFIDFMATTNLKE